MKSFDEVWELIIKYGHSDFKTKRGIPFIYEVLPVRSSTLIISSRKTALWAYTSKGSFEKAFEIGKCSGPGGYTGKKIGGQSYVWAILHDNRISNFL